MTSLGERRKFVDLLKTSTWGLLLQAHTSFGIHSLARKNVFHCESSVVGSARHLHSGSSDLSEAHDLSIPQNSLQYIRKRAWESGADEYDDVDPRRRWYSTQRQLVRLSTYTQGHWPDKICSGVGLCIATPWSYPSVCLLASFFQSFVCQPSSGISPLEPEGPSQVIVNLLIHRRLSQWWFHPDLWSTDTWLHQ